MLPRMRDRGVRSRPAHAAPSLFSNASLSWAGSCFLPCFLPSFALLFLSSPRSRPPRRQAAKQSAVSQERVDNILQENDALRTNLAALEQVTARLRTAS